MGKKTMLVNGDQLGAELEKFNNGGLFSVGNLDEQYVHRGVVETAIIEHQKTQNATFVITFKSLATLNYKTGEWESAEWDSVTNPQPYRLSLELADFFINNGRIIFIAPIIGESGSLSLEPSEE